MRHKVLTKSTVLGGGILATTLLLTLVDDVTLMSMCNLYMVLAINSIYKKKF